MFRRAFAVTILVLAVLTGCTRSDDRSTAASGVAPNFKLQDLKGKTVQLSDFKGKTGCARLLGDLVPALPRLYSRIDKAP